MTGGRSRLGITLLLCGTLLVLPPLASAQSEAGAPLEEEAGDKSVAKFLDYALCAVSIMGATTGIGVAVAVLTCGKAAVVWWEE